MLFKDAIYCSISWSVECGRVMKLEEAIHDTVYPRSEMFSRSSRYSEAQPEQAEAKRRST